MSRNNHYMSTLGNVPPAIAAMFDMDQEFGDAYTDLRELIYRDRPDGLSLAMKELLLVAFDVAVSNLGGAQNHLRAAQKAGLTDTQLHEMLMAVFLVFGVSAWGKVGHELWTTRNDPLP